MNNRLQGFTVLGLMLLGGAPFACGGTNSAGSGAGGAGNVGGSGATVLPSTPVAQGNFATAYGSALCDNVGACCTQYGFAFDHAACLTAATTRVGSVDTLDPGISYDPDAAGQCLAQIAALAKGCTLGANAELDLISCVTFAKGTLMPGQSCTSSAQCAAGPGSFVDCRSADPNAPSGPPVCVVSGSDAHGKAGDSCAATCSEIPNGAECDSVRSVVIGSGGASGTGSPNSAAVSCYTDDSLYCAAATNTC
ncbi:MAG TPA: hypothetical protein VGM29_09680, partial [Polyangiaceae bacterium]